jgi:hypothetical protein
MGIKVDTKQVDKLLDTLGDLPADAMTKAYPFLKSETPKKTGNARRKTSHRSNSLKIKSKYGYAGKLDEGWSRQAPDGFTDPTIDFIEDYINNQVRKL